MDILMQTQQAIQRLMLDDNFFAAIPVITEEKGDIVAEVEKAIAELGLAVVVEVIGGESRPASGSSGEIECDVVWTVTEVPVINRGSPDFPGRTATACIVEILRIFNPLRSVPLPARAAGWKLVNDVGGKLVYQATGTATLGWRIAG